MLRTLSGRWLLATAAAAVTVAGTAGVVRADAPRSFTITPGQGSASTAVWATLTFTVSPTDACQGQPIYFTWDGLAWGSVPQGTYIAGNGRCTGSITLPPPACAATAGLHTLAANAAFGQDSGTAMYDITSSGAATPCPTTAGQPTPIPPIRPSATPTLKAHPPNVLHVPSAAPLPGATPTSAAATPTACPTRVSPCAVVSATPPAPPPPAKPSLPVWPLLGGAVVVIAGAGAGRWYVAGRRKPQLPAGSGV